MSTMQKAPRETREGFLARVTHLIDFAFPRTWGNQWGAARAVEALDKAGLLASTPGDPYQDLLEMMLDFARAGGVEVPDGFKAYRWGDFNGNCVAVYQNHFGVEDRTDPSYRFVVLPYHGYMELTMFATTWKPVR